MIPKISVVIPLYNEKKNIAAMTAGVFKHVAPSAEGELIFVDDGSQDNTLAEIKKVANSDAKVFYLSLSRNFGHQNALRAGLDLATGEAVITMNGDIHIASRVIYTCEELAVVSGL